VTALAYAGCFLALAAAAGFAAASGTAWPVRLPVVALTPLLALGVWWQLSQRDGWPAGARPADGSDFVAGLVQAPSAGDRGAIYLWMQPPGSSTPRAFRVAYSPQLEQQVAAAARAEKGGARVAVRLTRRTGGSGGRSGHPTLRLVRLPPATLDVKGQVEHASG
jgi:hypothetical protein